MDPLLVIKAKRQNSLEACAKLRAAESLVLILDLPLKYSVALVLNQGSVVP